MVCKCIPPPTESSNRGRRVPLLLVGDLPSVCVAIAVLQSIDPDVEVVGAAFYGKDAMNLADAQRLTLVLVVVRKPGMHGQKATHIIKSGIQDFGCSGSSCSPRRERSIPPMRRVPSNSTGFRSKTRATPPSEWAGSCETETRKKEEPPIAER